VSIMGGASEFFDSLLLCCSLTGTFSPEDKGVKYVKINKIKYKIRLWFLN